MHGACRGALAQPAMPGVDDDGRFGSFWPPSYRATYDLRWMVEDGVIVGLRFTELDRGSRFDGRYRSDV